MHDPLSNKKITNIIFSVLIIGGVITVFNLFHAAKNVEHSFENVTSEYDGEIFV